MLSFHWEDITPIFWFFSITSFFGFLSSDIFPCVGEKTAKQIVEHLGLDCLKLINDDYANLLLVPKMTEKKMDSIYNEDGSIDYKFYDKSIIRITCTLIDNKDNKHIEVLEFK